MCFGSIRGNKRVDFTPTNTNLEQFAVHFQTAVSSGPVVGCVHLSVSEKENEKRLDKVTDLSVLLLRAPTLSRMDGCETEVRCKVQATNKDERKKRNLIVHSLKLVLSNLISPFLVFISSCLVSYCRIPSCLVSSCLFLSLLVSSCLASSCLA